MIKGKNIKLRLFQSENEISEMYNTYNELEERDEKDHTELHPSFKRIKRFLENGLWSDSEGELAVVGPDDGIVGSISFNKVDDFALELGYRIYRKKDRKKGYMREALRLFSRYLFDSKPNITRLEIKTAADNNGSRKLAEKCGFTQEGILRQAYFYRGKMSDFVIYSLLRSEI